MVVIVIDDHAFEIIWLLLWSIYGEIEVSPIHPELDHLARDFNFAS